MYLFVHSNDIEITHFILGENWRFDQLLKGLKSICFNYVVIVVGVIETNSSLAAIDVIFGRVYRVAKKVSL
jgi:hypothetical protein